MRRFVQLTIMLLLVALLISACSPKPGAPSAEGDTMDTENIGPTGDAALDADIAALDDFDEEEDLNFDELDEIDKLLDEI